MAQQPSFSSNNPFRRKAPAPPAPVAPPAAVPRFIEVEDISSHTPDSTPAPADRFRTQLQALSIPNQPPPTTSFQKPKVVKRVRVQSPPPSSPESPDISNRFPPASQDEDDDDDDDSSSSDDNYEPIEPFTAPPTRSAEVSDRGDERQPTPIHGPPPNPFQKTLQDLEVGITELEQSPGTTTSGARSALDVGAFGRLLLTGQTSGAGVSQGAAPYSQHTRYPAVPSGDGASTADTSSISRQSISDTLQAVHETPQTSRETSEHEAEDERRGLISSSQSSLQPAPAILKQKPPPPSSRHGKLINPGAAGEAAKGAAGGAQPPLSSPARRAATIPLLSPSRQRPSTPSDVNKPLPLAPHRSPAEEDVESVFAREVAGRLPEPQVQPGLNIIMPPKPPTPPNASHAIPSTPVPATQPSKKPAPPPRRQPHGRSESKVTSSAASVIQQDDADSTLRRSSFDSTRSRSSSLRVSIHAPAPPPPRRPGHQSRVSNSYSLPSSNALSEDATTTKTIDIPPITGPVVASPLSISGTSSSSSSTTPAPAPPAAAAAGVTTPTRHPAPNPNHPSFPTTKLAPPPPPPARNASVRGKRPANRAPSSLDAGLSRRSSGSRGKEPPPPPKHHPSRDRGGSRGSVDGAGHPLPLPPLSTASVTATATAAINEEVSAAGDILADLSALQREVDALRGQVGRGG
ncbi:hypothetical protein C8A00DRAFT_29400 [Chaetomidium leptoderma]|uniref:Uncharacterized protein n=1 Tax=Chaetomidium leptoderma TaxID=669021 RepID=A0AAN7A2C1_9PEZI|nr:hypothetical protein C8A00DRAFT_29400 [Chaetomidium leptoderma]